MRKGMFSFSCDAGDAMVTGIIAPLGLKDIHAQSMQIVSQIW